MRLFVLFIGPSGVGKSTLIEQILNKDNSFKYVAVYTDRELRKGEKNRVSITPTEFSKMALEGKFIAVNNNFTNRYGTSKESILHIVEEGKIPILDMQLKGVKTLAKFSNILLKIYVKPPSEAELKNRLNKDQRDNKDIRLHEGLKELEELEKVNFQHDDIHEVVINDNVKDTVNKITTIIKKYLNQK